MTGQTPAEEASTRPFLTIVRGDPTAEEVAALTVVLQAVAAASVAAPAPRRRPEWSAPHRAVRRPLRYGLGAWRAGPGAWRSSGLPG